MKYSMVLSILFALTFVFYSSAADPKGLGPFECRFIAVEVQDELIDIPLVDKSILPELFKRGTETPC